MSQPRLFDRDGVGYQFCLRKGFLHTGTHSRGVAQRMDKFEFMDLLNAWYCLWHYLWMES